MTALPFPRLVRRTTPASIMMNALSLGISLSKPCGETLLYLVKHLILGVPIIFLPLSLDGRNARLTPAHSDINALILDYLTMAGYPRAAAKFSREANLQPQQGDASIQARQEITRAIHTGQIERAIRALNELDPEVRHWQFSSLQIPSLL